MVALCLVLKGMMGALAPFSYLVFNIKMKCSKLFIQGGQPYCAFPLSRIPCRSLFVLSVSDG
jgi:hypothetical protein